TNARTRSRNRRRRFDQRKEGLDAERFGKMGVETSLLGLGHILGLRVAGQGYERNAREASIRAKRSSDLKAGYPGQPEVREDHIRLECPGLLDSLRSGVGDID